MAKEERKEDTLFQERNDMTSEYKLCANCGKHLRRNHNGNFCNDDCLNKYLDNQSEIKIKKWTNKKTQDKRRIIELSDLLNKKDLKVMVETVERNIDKKMNKLKR